MVKGLLDRGRVRVSNQLFDASVFISAKKNRHTCQQKSHEKKVRFGKQYYQGCRALVTVLHRRAEDKDSIVRDNVLLVCVFELLTFPPDLRVYKSDTDTLPPSGPP